MYACVCACHKGPIESLHLSTFECMYMRMRVYLCVTHAHIQYWWIESWIVCMYKPSYCHTCINASVSVHTQSVIRTIVTDLVHEKKT